MATLKELKEHYNITKYDKGGYFVYDKEEGSGKRIVYKYLCRLDKNGTKFGIYGTNEFYDKANEIKETITKHVESLEFDSEYYYPMYRVGLFEELVIHDYMSERGFKSELGWCADDIYFKLKEKDIYMGDVKEISISVCGLGARDELPENVQIKFHTGDYSWIESECKRDVHEIIKTIDSLLKPYYLTEATRNIKHADDYNLEEFKATINKLNLGS